MSSMNIGDISVQPVYDGYLTFPVEADYPAEGSPDYEAHRDSLQSDGRRRMTLGSFLIRLPQCPDRIILVDAGNGPSSGQLFRPGACDCPEHAHPDIKAYHDAHHMDGAARQRHLDWLSQTESRYGNLLDSLAARGVRPEQVTDVVLSHLHFDHIGWVSQNGAPAFPNATIRAAQKDIDHFLQPQQMIDDRMYQAAWGVLPTAERLAPVMDRIESWDGDVTLFPGLDAVATPGHTPGHSIFVLSSGEKRGMLLGDVVHCPLQLTDPDFSVMADIDQQLANRQRERVYREMVGDPNLAVAASHFPGLRFGRILEGAGRSGWTFVS
ncbi:MBL fold metallo-hydrolase [Sphingobium lactosutens]|uniref:MBL fold metallo-hydrolase n=1 Tax=Sphingobium lactosutens TaxID=522773 RepID=UPI0015BF96AB|nr:MBL fold metallo-hydrolase [Sphingobium lactosutens]